MHRHTLRSRVQTAATLLQRDLDDPDTRAELWAALRVLGATA
ncbi:helix-turn-helix domain-containing protein [Leucobacter soli]